MSLFRSMDNREAAQEVADTTEQKNRLLKVKALKQIRLNDHLNMHKLSKLFYLLGS